MRRACALPGAVLVLRVRCTHGGVLRPLYCTHPAGDCTHCIPYRLCAPLWSSGKGCGRRPPRSGHGPPGRRRQRRSSSRPLRARLPVLPRQRRRRRSRSVTSRSVTTRGRSKSHRASCARCRCGRVLHRRSPPLALPVQGQNDEQLWVECGNKNCKKGCSERQSHAGWFPREIGLRNKGEVFTPSSHATVVTRGER